jgi:hypothetical protein
VRGDEYLKLLNKNFQKHYDELSDSDYAIEKFIDNNLSKTDIKKQASYYNLPFIENAFKRGDNIRLLSDYSNPDILFGFFQREVEAILGKTGEMGLMEKYGYKLNEATATFEKIK